MATKMEKGDKMTPKGEFFGDIMIALLEREGEKNKEVEKKEWASFQLIERYFNLKTFLYSERDFLCPRRKARSHI